MDGLEGRTFVVTGAGSGIGRATATRLATVGANVVMLDIDLDRVDAAATAIGAGRRLFPAAVDVRDAAAVADAVTSGAERFGGLQGAVTAAGIFDPADLTDLEHVDLDVFDRVLAVNLLGTVHTLRAALPAMTSGGAVVTIASTAGLRGHGFGSAYTSSKGAVVALTRLVAVQYGPKGIRANCVCPGATAGEGMGAVFADPATATQVSADLPLRRVGLAADVGATVAALLSDETRYVTGQVIAVDGGATVR